ncbi:MAG: hypothetical protein CMF69_07355 [Magnetovibrio sp.]|nr:hypothetical protein [Magnetovibrio sp.]|tara:strand:- start:2102 stop:2407 length:306 start_codon:yes stop_codon:yes gene_type:complete
MIKSYLSKTLLAMLMDKKARKKFHAMRLERPDTKDNVQSKDEFSRISTTSLRAGVSERKILIEQAMRLRNAKSYIFDQFDQKTRTKLRTIAGKALCENIEE